MAHVMPPVVLIVEGDTTARVGYAQAFERHGCTAVMAASVSEAITCLSRPWLEISVVWLSLDMPDAPGETVLAVLKNTPRLSHVRTVAHWAAGDDDGRIVDLAGYGAAGFVDEPGEFEDVWDACFPGG